MTGREVPISRSQTRPSGSLTSTRLGCLGLYENCLFCCCFSSTISGHANGTVDGHGNGNGNGNARLRDLRSARSASFGGDGRRIPWQCSYMIDAVSLARPSGTRPKRRRTEDELLRLASNLCSDWVPGDRVMTWLNENEGKAGRLSDLVRCGWCWEDLGRALALAGVMHRTGRPISGPVLRSKACKARTYVRRRTATSTLSRPWTMSYEANWQPPAAEEAPARDTAVFPLVSSRGDWRPHPQTRFHEHRVDTATPTDLTDDELIARALGRL
jgi:hypothetical protein